MNKNLNMGLFGYGCVGQGLHDVLNSAKGLKANIQKICVKDRSKPRRLPADRFTFNKNEVLNDPDINLVVELIDDANEAFSIVSSAMKNGKNVVTANKKMVAEHLQELVNIQEETGSSLLYEAAACGSIPIIRNLEEYYDNELLYSIRGIFNGSSNYILSKMFNEQRMFSDVLAEAQKLGFAETNPSLDIEGVDAKYKLVILALHAYGLFIRPEEVFNYGISHISKHDIGYASEKGYKIKLVPWMGKLNNNTIGLFVLPRFISQEKYLYNVDYEYNAVIAEAAFSDKQFFYGKGAGGHPTGSAVLSDISASTYNYKYEYKKKHQHNVNDYSADLPIEIYLRYHQKSDRNQFSFQSISESFSGNDFNYVIGVTRLKDLMSMKDKLNKMDVFIVNTGKKFI